MIEINGRKYPLWSQFVEKKDKFIDGVLEDFGDSMDRRIFEVESVTTTITDILLKENGKDSAWFEVSGKDFNCGFDVKVGGITAGEEGYITFSGYGGHTWRIKGKE